MSRIIAVDFDGTLCENKWPDIGYPNKELIEQLIKAKRRGDKLILWTCRGGDYLDTAIAWCAGHGLKFDAVNENLPEIVERFESEDRKIYADIYLDDRAMVPVEFIYRNKFLRKNKENQNG